MNVRSGLAVDPSDGDYDLSSNTSLRKLEFRFNRVNFANGGATTLSWLSTLPPTLEILHIGCNFLYEQQETDILSFFSTLADLLPEERYPRLRGVQVTGDIELSCSLSQKIAMAARSLVKRGVLRF